MLLNLIELYLRRTRTPPARFGREVLGDPNFVFDLKDGREPRSATRRKVRAYICAREPDLVDPR
jgi:hypothetical protein